MYWSDNFLELYTLGKALKQQYYLINDNSIMGTDESMSILSLIYLDKSYNIGTNIYYEKKKISKYFKKNFNYTFNNGEYEIVCDNNVYLLVNELSYNILNLYKKVCLFSESNRLIYTKSNLRDDDNFNNIISYKKNDGMVIYNIENKFLMTLFSGIFPVNKNDGVDLEIYHVDKTSYLSKFIIHKSKYDILLFIRFRYLT